MPMWVYETDLRDILEVNDAAVAAYGYSREEFLRLNLFDLRPPEDVERLRNYLHGRSASQLFAGEWRHRHKDGKVVDVEVYLHDIEFNGRAARLALLIDVTDRKRLERESQRIFETSEDLLLVTRRLRPHRPGQPELRALAGLSARRNGRTAAARSSLSPRTSNRRARRCAWRAAARRGGASGAATATRTAMSSRSPGSAIWSEVGPPTLLHRPRHDGVRQHRGRSAPGVRDGGDRPAHRRRGARLQQHPRWSSWPTSMPCEDEADARPDVRRPRPAHRRARRSGLPTSPASCSPSRASRRCEPQPTDINELVDGTASCCAARSASMVEIGDRAGRRPVGRRDRPRPARDGAGQSRDQRARRHAGRRQAQHRDQQSSLLDAGYAAQHRGRAGDYVDARGQRHRQRHAAATCSPRSSSRSSPPRTSARAPVSASAWSTASQAVQGPHPDRERGRPRHDRAALSAAQQRQRRKPPRRRPRLPPCRAATSASWWSRTTRRVRSGVRPSCKSLGYEVIEARATATSGLAAFEARRAPFDLLLTDVIDARADATARRWPTRSSAAGPAPSCVFMSGYSENILSTQVASSRACCC